MSRVPSWRRYLRFWRPDVAGDVDDELRFHLQTRTEELIARGVPADAARAQALEEFGDVEEVRAGLTAIGERMERQHSRAAWWDALWQDAKFAVRSLGRRPGLTAMIVITLALGLGVNAAMFSLIDKLFFRAPAGVVDPGSLRRLYLEQHLRGTGELYVRTPFSYPEFRDMRTAALPVTALGAYQLDNGVRLGRGEGAPEITAAFTSPGFLELLGVRPALGRFFDADEGRMGAGAPVAVLSHAFWLRKFGGDPGALGRIMELGRERYTIIGIAPKGFSGIDLEAVDVWVPLARPSSGAASGPPWYELRGDMGLRVLARLAPGADERRLTTAASLAFHSGAREAGVRVDSLAAIVTGPINEARGPGRYRKQEIAISVRLAGVAIIVLVIACANVANLLLARAMQRRREIAVRLALGVSRARLIAQLLTESTVLALLGGGAALAMGAWAGLLLRRTLLPDVHWADGPFGARLVLFVAAAALATGMLAGLMPALQASRPDVAGALKAGARDGSFQGSRVRTALIVAQGALSVVLLVGAGLFVHSLGKVSALDVGYDAERLVFATVAFDDGKDHRAERASLLPEAARRIATMPGVERVALSSITPMWGFGSFGIFLPGRDSLPELARDYPTFIGVSPEFFAAAGMRILRGRGFTAADDEAGAPLAVIVNESMAHTLWPGADALGQCIRLESETQPCYTVVGVVSDARRGELIEEPALQYYLPLGQIPSRGYSPSTLVVRAMPERAAGVGELVRGDLRRLFPAGEPRIRPMATIIAPKLRPWRLGAALFSALGALALVVAAVGIYSVIAYTFSQRTHELGVRIALGARTSNVLRLVIAEGLRMVLIGIVVGIVLALAAGKLVASLLYGVSPRDPMVITAVALTLLAVAILACLLPAWRAARVDPVVALRAE